MTLLTLARDLRRRKARERQLRFVAEGFRSVAELLRSPLEIHGLLLDEEVATSAAAVELLQRADARRLPHLLVSASEFKSASDTDAPQGVLAIARIPARRLADLELRDRAPLVILDALQDPGNVGTILRTAAALGASGTVALPGTVDLWNAKVVRGAMGAHFHHAALHSTAAELDAFLHTHSLPLWAASALGEPAGARAAPTRVALAIGNEGAGLSEALLARAQHRISIPIEPDVESLNAAVATGILLYLLRS